jgi:thiamine pyrophosphate-dependent acetolactate synthase large subunit-like protein
MKVYEALADAFVAEGTTGVFTMMGDANMYWLNALAQRGVQIYDVRHEGAGLAMADGWARATGRPGVCSTTSGPGTAQLATTMVVASRARTPLVAFCGDVATEDRENAQCFDQERFAAAVEAGFVRMSSAAAAHDATREAFSLARRDSRPVVLSVPEELQQQAFGRGRAYTASSVLLEDAPIRPDPEQIRAAAEIVAGGARPVVLVGRGAMRSEAGEIAVRLAGRIGALVATTLIAKGWLDEADYDAGVAGGYATKTARDLFREADRVIVAGASLNQYTTERGRLFPNAKIVQLDSADRVVISGGREADCYVRADARLGLEALDELLAERAFSAAGFRTDEVKERLRTAYADPAAFELEPGTVDPRQACAVLDETIPAGFGLVLGSGQQVRFATMLLRRPRPYVIAQHHFGCIGQGLTTAMGAVLARGKEPAFLVEGDAGFMMHLAEFETAVRYDLPLLVVVMNDEGLGAEYHKSVAVGLDGRLALIPTPDLGRVGVGLGGRGALVCSLDELRSLAAEFVARPGPTLLDVRISRNVLSIPYRRAFYGEDV